MTCPDQTVAWQWPVACHSWPGLTGRILAGQDIPQEAEDRKDRQEAGSHPSLSPCPHRQGTLKKTAGKRKAGRHL